MVQPISEKAADHAQFEVKMQKSAEVKADVKASSKEANVTQNAQKAAIVESDSNIVNLEA